MEVAAQCGKSGRWEPEWRAGLTAPFTCVLPVLTLEHLDAISHCPCTAPVPQINSEINAIITTLGFTWLVGPSTLKKVGGIGVVACGDCDVGRRCGQISWGATCLVGPFKLKKVGVVLKSMVLGILEDWGSKLKGGSKGIVLHSHLAWVKTRPPRCLHR